MVKQGKLLIALMSIIIALSACTTGAPNSDSKSAANKPAESNSGKEQKAEQKQGFGKPIKLGHLSPLTGRAASHGQIQKIAVEMAVEEINKTGGINGSPVEMLYEDDQLNPQQAVTQYRKLVSENVVGVLGPMSGASWENVGPLANQFKVPTINSNALKPGITKLPWAMRIHPPDDKMIPEGVKAFTKHFPNVKKVVVIGDVKEASGASGVEEFKKAAAAEGLEVLDTVGYQTGATDFSPVITKVKGLKPDAIFVSSLQAESLGVAKEIERQGMDVPVLVSALSWAGSFNASVGTSGKNWYSIGYSTNEPPASNEKLVKFTNEFLKRAEGNSAIPKPANISNATLAYDAIMMIADTLRKEKVNGDTPLEEARQKLQQSFVKIKDYKGLNEFSMLPSGDGYIPSRILKMDVDKKIWVEMK